MIEQRETVATVGFVDEYAQQYRPRFGDIRLYECFKFLHIGMLNNLPRKSLAEIDKNRWTQRRAKLALFLTQCRVGGCLSSSDTIGNHKAADWRVENYAVH